MAMPATEEALKRELGDIKEQAVEMAAALHTVVCESDDAESVRTCVAALLGCQLGRSYLEIHPLRY